MEPICRVYGNQNRANTGRCPLEHRVCTNHLVSIPQGTGREKLTYLVFPIITPILSPFCTPMPNNPLASASTCLPNSSKSQAKCLLTPIFLDGGPPCALGFSFLAIKAGLSPYFSRISDLQYPGRVWVESGGSSEPSTYDCVSRARRPVELAILDACRTTWRLRPIMSGM